MLIKKHKYFPILKLTLRPSKLEIVHALCYQLNLGSSQVFHHDQSCELWVELAAERLESIQDELSILLEQWQAMDAIDHMEIQEISSKDWIETYEKYLKPFCFLAASPKNDELWIDPREDPFPALKNHSLRIKASLAFGTGTHPTTRLSARFIQEVLTEHPVKRFLDVGCGTGILAMTAKKYGAKKIIAVDNDIEALEIARYNFQQNHCPEITIIHALDQVDGQFQLVVANILLETLLTLKNSLLERLSSPGKLILSGLLKQDVPEALKAYQDLQLHKQADEGDWSALMLLKQ